MEGWIKLHRKIVEHEIWNDVTTFRLFMYLLLKAAYKEYEYRGFKLKPGQYIRSYSKLAEDLSYIEGRGYKKLSKNTVFRATKILIDKEMIAVHETELGTMFTVLNYQYYQGFEEDEKPFAERLTERSQNEVRTKSEQEKEVKRNIRIYKDVISHLNAVAKTSFRDSTKKTQTLIDARVKEGFSFDDFVKVIDVKTAQWMDNPKMNKYLRPETLFGNKFESYLNEHTIIEKPFNQTDEPINYSKFDFNLNKGEG